LEKTDRQVLLEAWLAVTIEPLSWPKMLLILHPKDPLKGTYLKTDRGNLHLLLNYQGLKTNLKKN